MTATRLRSRSGKKTKTIFPVSELGTHFEHALLLNGDHGGPGALYYLCVTMCEYHNETFAPALPIIHLGGLPEASDKLGILFPESGPPGPKYEIYLRALKTYPFIKNYLLFLIKSILC